MNATSLSVRALAVALPALVELREFKFGRDTNIGEAGWAPCCPS